MNERYFLTGFCDCAKTSIHEHEVTKDEYVAAERSAGFYSIGYEPATAGFAIGGVAGRVENEQVWDESQSVMRKELDADD